MKKYAFTMVEIALTLIIIGVLAAVMIKSVNSDEFDEKASVAAALKVINNIDQAALKMIEQNLGDDIEYGNADTAFSAFKSYIQYKKEFTTFGDCSGADSCAKCKTASLPSGSCIAFQISNGACNQDKFKFTYPGETSDRLSGKAKDTCWGILYVDTNGKKLPNEYGKDIYKFPLYGKGVAI